MIVVRDKKLGPGSVLIDFAPIADCLEPEASGFRWTIPDIDGMLTEDSGIGPLDSAYEYADASVTAPIAWQQLRDFTANFFQIYNCEFHAVDGDAKRVRVRCLDSGRWEIITESQGIVDRLRSSFKNVDEEPDV